MNVNPLALAVSLASLIATLAALRYLHRAHSEPAPPENVVVVMADGREIPVDCTYEGHRDGAHVWRMVTPVVGQLAQIRIGKLPPNTTVHGWVREP